MDAICLNCESAFEVRGEVDLSWELECPRCQEGVLIFDDGKDPQPQIKTESPSMELNPLSSPQSPLDLLLKDEESESSLQQKREQSSETIPTSTVGMIPLDDIESQTLHQPEDLSKTIPTMPTVNKEKDEATDSFLQDSQSDRIVLSPTGSQLRNRGPETTDSLDLPPPPPIIEEAVNSTIETTPPDLEKLGIDEQFEHIEKEKKALAELEESIRQEFTVPTPKEGEESDPSELILRERFQLDLDSGMPAGDGSRADEAVEKELLSQELLESLGKELDDKINRVVEKELERLSSKTELPPIQPAEKPTESTPFSPAEGPDPSATTEDIHTLSKVPVQTAAYLSTGEESGGEEADRTMESNTVGTAEGYSSGAELDKTELSLPTVAEGSKGRDKAFPGSSPFSSTRDTIVDEDLPSYDKIVVERGPIPKPEDTARTENFKETEEKLQTSYLNRGEILQKEEKKSKAPGRQEGSFPSYDNFERASSSVAGDGQLVSGSSEQQFESPGFSQDLEPKDTSPELQKIGREGTEGYSADSSEVEEKGDIDFDSFSQEFFDSPVKEDGRPVDEDDLYQLLLKEREEQKRLIRRLIWITPTVTVAVILMLWSLQFLVGKKGDESGKLAQRIEGSQLPHLEPKKVDSPKLQLMETDAPKKSGTDKRGERPAARRDSAEEGNSSPKEGPTSDGEKTVDASPPPGKGEPRGRGGEAKEPKKAVDTSRSEGVSRGERAAGSADSSRSERGTPSQMAGKTGVKRGSSGKRGAISAKKTERKSLRANKKKRKRNRKLAQSYVKRAQKYILGGDLKRAIRYLLRARRADPTYPPIYRMLGLLYFRQGKKGLARRYLRRFLKLAPSDPASKAVKTLLKRL